ncbi:tRNA (adenosine(37)-N6)-threonylcarbamoyltransferase complex ATPase subunit type 1 TsaE [Candidatus Pelagibacter sp.]|nr:tRNA (adenosine(37)-N6)-threonylcarbamoyltransferase complex ATPase subunit type 1 TsaE [Candidatus Pelagibacter sp.]
MHIATKSSKIDISKEIVTKKVAEQLANVIKKNFTLLFYGNIGVGKTTFIRYFINQLQKKNKLEISEVPSPTFNLIHEYKINSLIIRHFDLYRIKDKKDLDNLGINEDVKDYVRLIEWPEILGQNVESTFSLKFEYDEKLESRYLIISSNIDFDFNEFEKI